MRMRSSVPVGAAAVSLCGFRRCGVLPAVLVPTAQRRLKQDPILKHNARGREKACAVPFVRSLPQQRVCFARESSSHLEQRVVEEAGEVPG